MQAYNHQQIQVGVDNEINLKISHQSSGSSCLPVKDFKPFHPVEIVVHAPAAYDDKAEDRMLELGSDLDDIVFADAESLTPSAYLVEEGSISTADVLIAEYWAESLVDMGDVIYNTDSAMDLQEDDIEPIKVSYHNNSLGGMDQLEDQLEGPLFNGMEIDINPAVDYVPEPDMNDNRDNENRDNDNSNLNEDIMQPTADKPPPNDVLTGQSRNLHKHPGNINLRHLAQASYDEYIRVKGNPAETTLFYQRIQDTLNVRFWKEDGHGRWIQMIDPNEIHQIVASKFRSITRMRNRNQKKESQANGNHGNRKRKANKRQNNKKKQRNK